MRFIAVFTQLLATQGIGFDSFIEANDFLFWGHEDRTLVPLGIYDTLTAQVSLYEHAGQSMRYSNPESIRQFALNFQERVRQRSVADA